MSRPPIITAIDIGTDKCVTLIATPMENTDQLSVIGVSVVPSHGIKRSQIIDLEAVVKTISESVTAAERMANVSVKHAIVSFNGPHINSQNSSGVVPVTDPNQEISDDDVRRVIDAAKAVSLPSDRSVVHVIPCEFKVDSQRGIRDPIGMTGIRLESETHLITGLTTAMTNLEKAMHDVGISVDSFVFAGLASSEVVTTETERELGVVVVDIGAGCTTISAFVDGILQLSTAIPLGARHVTQDVALGCRVSIDSAEKIKLALSSQQYAQLQPRAGESKDELNRRRKAADRLDPRQIGVHEDIEELSKKTVVEGIIAPRLKEIITVIGQTLDDNHLLPLVPAGLVITGGGAETVGITDISKMVLRLPARVGTPPRLLGLTEDIHKPAYATVTGLVKYGYKHSREGHFADAPAWLDLAEIPFIQSAIKNIKKLVQSLLP